MKRKNVIIYFSELLLLIYIIIFKILILKNIPNYVDVINFLFLGTICFSLYKLLGLKKKRASLNYNAGQLIIITLIIYYISIYLFGLFFGFLKNTYSLTLISIFKNVFGAAVFCLLKEIYRFLIISKGNSKNMFSSFIATLLLAILDIIMEINGYNLSTNIGIFEAVEALIIPKIALSFFLSYISYNFDYKLSILFLFIFDLPKYFLPLIPDLGMYISSIVTLVLIFVLYYQLSIEKEKYERQIKTNKKHKNKYKILIIILPLLVLVGLVSGLFRYHLFAIGSNSMLPYFAKGDAALIKKLNDDEYTKLKNGDVVAFYFNDQIIVHRIISIVENDNVFSIKTKGDNNEEVDAWTVSNDMIYGKVIFVIPYIGLPSVELSELMSKGDVNGER